MFENDNNISNQELDDSWVNLGHVSRTTGSQVFVNISSSSALSQISIGHYLLVLTGEYGILGQVEFLASGEKGTVLTANLINSINLESGDVTAGIAITPNPSDEAYIAPPEVTQLALQANSKLKDQKVVFSFANLDGKGNLDLDVTPEMILSRHLAILGATGSGKSCSISKIVEEMAKFKSKVVLFDATGEFSTLKKGTKHIHLGYSPDPIPGSLSVSLPYFQLRESDLFAIFKPSGESQAPKLRSAIKSLKLSLLEPTLTLDGLVMKANKTKMQFESAYQKHYAAVEGYLAEFDITRLSRQIINECVNPTRSATEPLVWGDYNSTDQSNCIPMMNRIQEVIQSKDLSCIFSPGDTPSLLDELDDFMAHPDQRILCISLEHLSFANNAREIVANATGRHLLAVARKGDFKNNPLLVIVDEAHHFLNEKLLSSDADYPLDSFGLIAKEGRKYGLNICLATQRPRDIPEDVLSQMGTMIVHRLINIHDRKVVESACGSIDAGSISKLPVLSPGQAVITGVSFPTPLLVRMKFADNPPRSSGPNYQEAWANDSSDAAPAESQAAKDLLDDKKPIRYPRETGTTVIG